MVEIADLRDCAPSGLFYGGRAGQKEGILIEGEPWIAKYPRTTRDLAGKHLPSYTSSPVSEYLGSHIYELLGIPVNETMLGYRAGKIVCACRDFTFPNARLFEFKEIKNALSDDDAGFSSAPSDGEVILLGDVLADIKCFAAAVDMEAIDTLIDSVPEGIFLFFMTVLGCMSFASLTQGWFIAKNTLPDALLLACSTIIMLYPALLTGFFLPHDQRYWGYLIGIGIMGLLAYMQHARTTQTTEAAA